jgi:DNA (cytosine-5)-methyltransferase 1
LQREALGAAFGAHGGRSAFFRRLAWDRPCPTLTTRPDSTATLLCHPTELRSLSIEEFARIQEFPEGWQFSGGMHARFAQIGNAVPLKLGHAIGEELRAATRRGRRNARVPAGVFCLSPDLLERLLKRSRTFLNAPHLRIVADERSAREWMRKKPDGTTRSRSNRTETLRELLEARASGRRASSRAPRLTR